MPFTFPIEHESPSKKKRAEQQRKIKERNHQIADIEADRKARQQNVRDKYSAPLPDQAKETKRKVADVARQKRLRQPLPGRSASPLRWSTQRLRQDVRSHNPNR